MLYRLMINSSHLSLVKEKIKTILICFNSRLKLFNNKKLHTSVIQKDLKLRLILIRSLLSLPLRLMDQTLTFVKESKSILRLLIWRFLKCRSKSVKTIQMKLLLLYLQPLLLSLTKKNNFKLRLMKNQKQLKILTMIHRTSSISQQTGVDQ